MAKEYLAGLRCGFAKCQYRPNDLLYCSSGNKQRTLMKKIIGDSQDMDLVKKRIVNAFHNTLISSANKWKRYNVIARFNKKIF